MSTDTLRARIVAWLRTGAEDRANPRHPAANDSPSTVLDDAADAIERGEDRT